MMGAWPLPAYTLPDGPCNGIWNPWKAQRAQPSCARGWKCSQKIPQPGADPSTPLPFTTCICRGGAILEGSGFEMYRIVAKTPFFLAKPCCEEIKIACWGEQTNCGGIPKISCVKGKVWMHALKKECVAYALLCFHYTAICWLLGSINKLRYLY